MADEFDLAAFLETVGTGLQDLARSSAVQGAVRYDIPRAQIKDRGIVIDKDDTLVINIDDPRLDVELPRLRNILANSSMHAGIIYEFVKDAPAMLIVGEATVSEFNKRHRVALRLAVTMRDSLLQMSKLLNGEGLDEPELSPNHPASGNLTDEEMEESGYDGPMVDDDSSLRVNEFKSAMKLAEVHTRLKALCTAGEQITQQQVRGVMDYISTKGQHG